MENEKKEGYDFINPNHYKKGGKEVWQMMIAIWGKEAYMKHCEMTAFKYRMRAGTKPGESIERDLNKAAWYENMAQQMREELRIENGEDLPK